jgi:hypothetical protein
MGAFKRRLRWYLINAARGAAKGEREQARRHDYQWAQDYHQAKLTYLAVLGEIDSVRFNTASRAKAGGRKVGR